MHFSPFKSPSYPLHAIRLAMCALVPACTEAALAEGRSLPSFRVSSVRPSGSPRPASTPYLLACLPPALRFADPVETASDVPPAARVIGPPHPAGIVEEVASTNRDAALPAPVHLPEPAPAPPTPPAPDGPAATPRPETGISILPDETPRPIGSADVLPFFQFPPTTSAPTLPRSSATYSQQ